MLNKHIKCNFRG